MATAMARAVSSRRGRAGVISGGVSRALAAAGFSGAGAASAPSWSSVISASENACDDAVQLGEALVADLESALAALVFQFHFCAEFTLQLFHQLSDLGAGAGVLLALLSGQSLRLEPLHQR